MSESDHWTLTVNTTGGTASVEIRDNRDIVYKSEGEAAYDDLQRFDALTRSDVETVRSYLGYVSTSDVSKVQLMAYVVGLIDWTGTFRFYP